MKKLDLSNLATVQTPINSTFLRFVAPNATSSPGRIDEGEMMQALATALADEKIDVYEAIAIGTNAAMYQRTKGADELYRRVASRYGLPSLQRLTKIDAALQRATPRKTSFGAEPLTRAQLTRAIAAAQNGGKLSEVHASYLAARLSEQTLTPDAMQLYKSLSLPVAERMEIAVPPRLPYTLTMTPTVSLHDNVGWIAGADGFIQIQTNQPPFPLIQRLGLDGKSPQGLSESELRAAVAWLDTNLPGWSPELRQVLTDVLAP